MTAQTIFSLNENISRQNSGIEFAELQRFNVFRGRIPFKLVTIKWNQKLHSDINFLGLKDDELINLFDYYQGTTNVEPKKIFKEDLNYGIFGEDITFEKTNGNAYIVRDSNNNFYARVHLFENDTVSSIEYFDLVKGNLYRNSIYDERGFESLRQLYSPDNKLINEQWMTIDGGVAISSFNKEVKNAGKNSFQKTAWTLRDEKRGGEVFVLDDIIQLQTKFYDDINRDYFNGKNTNVFVIDRSDEIQEAVLNMETPSYKVFHLHNSHGGNTEEERFSIPNNHYEYGMFNIEKFDAVISATEKQNNDFYERVKPVTTKLFRIPVGTIDDNKFKTTPKLMEDRIPHSIVVTARHAMEKRIDDIIRAASIVKEFYPDIVVNTYGYYDGSENYLAKRLIEHTIEECDMKDNVHINGYSSNTEKVQEENQIYGLASSMEGFNIALMEGLSNGDVAVSYDVNYGPNELVIDGENGFLVEQRDYKALAEKIKLLFDNPELLQKMSDNAFETSKRFSVSAVWEQWQKLLTDSNNIDLTYFDLPTRHNI